jgi:hypothetical protein
MAYIEFMQLLKDKFKETKDLLIFVTVGKKRSLATSFYKVEELMK